MLSNDVYDHVARTRSSFRVEQTSKHPNPTPRNLQRLSMKYLGVTPLRVIRRFRLQEAAQQVHENKQLPFAQIATEIQYVDQAHVSEDFKEILRISPRGYKKHGPPLMCNSSLCRAVSKGKKRPELFLRSVRGVFSYSRNP